ncbi:MAG TPA: hypothetical protein VLP43_05050 [Solirubrobacteraceae bacterium]|nr:hypothetical protein [Solirubrobacteraceae bacterium]
MYQLSRAIYREIAGEIVEDPHSQCAHANHERVLHACEAAIERLATDRHYFARPTRTLFHDIRAYFPMSSQSRVLHVIERYLAYADEFLARQPQNGFDAYGNPLQCRASTRKGTPCQRMPLPHNGYCPSHQHLAETEELTAPLAA